jgi:hypothetical protein
VAALVDSGALLICLALRRRQETRLKKYRAQADDAQKPRNISPGFHIFLGSPPNTRQRRRVVCFWLYNSPVPARGKILVRLKDAMLVYPDYIHQLAGLDDVEV